MMEEKHIIQAAAIKWNFLPLVPFAQSSSPLSQLPWLRSKYFCPKFNACVSKQHDKKQCKFGKLDGNIISASLHKQVTLFNLKLTLSMKDCLFRIQNALFNFFSCLQRNHSFE